MKTLLSRIRGALTSRPRLRLYSMEHCYYCRRVLREANRLGIKLPVVDVFSDPEGREYLRQKTGKTRVPVLAIIDENGTERFLPESEDIIRYLREIAEGDEVSPRGQSRLPSTPTEEPSDPARVPLGAPREDERERGAAE